MEEETVTIPKATYDILLHRDAVLAELEAAGVDNWEGYEDALDASEEG